MRSKHQTHVLPKPTQPLDVTFLVLPLGVTLRATAVAIPCGMVNKPDSFLLTGDHEDITTETEDN